MDPNIKAEHEAICASLGLPATATRHDVNRTIIGRSQARAAARRRSPVTASGGARGKGLPPHLRAALALRASPAPADVGAAREGLR